MAATCAATALPRCVAAADGGEIRAMLLHLGYNMWCEWLPDELMSTAKIAKEYKADVKLRGL